MSKKIREEQVEDLESARKIRKGTLIRKSTDQKRFKFKKDQSRSRQIKTLHET
jgi:hypothetical protein